MAQKPLDSFGSCSTLKVGNPSYIIFRLDRLGKARVGNRITCPAAATGTRSACR